MIRPSLFLLIVLIHLAVSSSLCPCAAGIVRLEGFYEFRTDINQENSAFAPNIESDGSTDRGAKNYFQGRLYADPAPGVNMYTKLELDSKGDDKFRFSEGHLFFKKEVNKKTVEWILFDSQDRFRMDDPLLEITQGKSDLRGMRMNLYAWNGWAHLYQGRFKNANEDAFALRFGKNFFRKNRLSVGGSAIRKAWSTGYDDVGAMDVTLRFGEAELIAAGAVSYTTVYTEGARTLFQSELKNLRLSSRRLGSIRMSSAFRNWFPGYRNYLGKNPEKREVGLFNEIVYELPFKSMRLTAKQDKKREVRSTVFVRPERRTDYWYGELFMEFQKGYKAKVFYDVYNDPWTNNINRPNLFFQIESFSKSNTLKAQIKYKDYGNLYEKTIFAVQDSFNFTDNLFFLIRVLHAFEDQPILSRNSLFLQVRYKVRDNGNVFLEFGNNDHGNDDLANDGSFADNSGVNTDRIAKMILQLWW